MKRREETGGERRGQGKRGDRRRGEEGKGEELSGDVSLQCAVRGGTEITVNKHTYATMLTS